MSADTEDGRLVVSEAIKFPVTRQTAKTSHGETQTHGFDVDLVGARRDRLVLATVKWSCSLRRGGGRLVPVSR